MSRSERIGMVLVACLLTAGGVGVYFVSRSWPVISKMIGADYKVSIREIESKIKEGSYLGMEPAAVASSVGGRLYQGRHRHEMRIDLPNSGGVVGVYFLDMEVENSVVKTIWLTYD